jgi:hypothetical protein
MIPSTVYVEDVGHDTQAGLVAGAMFEKLLADWASGGSFAYVGRVGGEEGARATVATLGAQFKLHFGSPSTLDLRVGFGVGANFISVSGVSGTVKGLNVMPIVELFLPRAGWRLGIQSIGISQPAGGNDDAFVSFYPIPAFLLALEHGL